MSKVESHIATNSERQVWQQCQYKWGLQYGLGIRPKTNSDALEFGSLFHTAMEAWWGSADARVAHAIEAISEPLREMERAHSGGFSTQNPVARKKDKISEWRALLHSMIRGYEHQWGSERGRYRLVMNEATITAATRTSTGKRSPWASYKGVVDKVIEDEDGQIWIMDHKTSGSPLNLWLSRNEYNPQAATYGYLYREAYGVMPVGICYDLALKSAPADPSEFRVTKTEPKRLHKGTPANATSRGFIEAIRRIGGDLDSEDWYRDKLAGLDRRALSGQFFKREWIRWTHSDLERVGSELYATATQLRQAHAITRDGRERLIDTSGDWAIIAPEIIRDLSFNLPRQNSCYSYGRACPYLEICRVATDEHETRYLLSEYRLTDRIHEETQP